MEVVAGWVFEDVGVGGGGGFARCGYGGFCFVSSVWGWSMVVSAVRLRPCVVGDGFYALHWKVLSWLEFGRCVKILRVLRRGGLCEMLVGVV